MEVCIWALMLSRPLLLLFHHYYATVISPPKVAVTAGGVVGTKLTLVCHSYHLLRSTILVLFQYRTNPLLELPKSLFHTVSVHAVSLVYTVSLVHIISLVHIVPPCPHYLLTHTIC